MPKHIFGIDPSLTGTGVCIIEAGSAEIVHIATVLPKERRGVARLDWIIKQLEKHISPHFTEDDPFFIEGYAFGARGRGVLNLGELGGVLRLYLAKRYGGYYEVPPTSLKKFVCGKGNANKNVVLEKVYRKYCVGSEVLQDDNQVDAYGLARLGDSFIKFENGSDANLAEYEAAALQKIGEKCTL